MPPACDDGPFPMMRHEVAAGIVWSGSEVLIARRQEHDHQGGRWEFPGGKRRGSETIEQCLRREMLEEVGIEVAVGPLWRALTHVYPDRAVSLYFFLCESVRGRRAPSNVPRCGGIPPDALAPTHLCRGGSPDPPRPCQGPYFAGWLGSPDHSLDPDLDFDIVPEHRTALVERLVPEDAVVLPVHLGRSRRTPRASRRRSSGPSPGRSPSRVTGFVTPRMVRFPSSESVPCARGHDLGAETNLIVGILLDVEEVLALEVVRPVCRVVRVLMLRRVDLHGRRSTPPGFSAS